MLHHKVFSALSIFLLLPLATTQQDKTTPTPYHPNDQNDAKDNQDEDDRLNNADFPNPDDNANDVMYVSPDDYKLPDAESPGDQKDSPVSEKSRFNADYLPTDRDRYSEFGGINTATDLYRLLAMGPQQSDPSLGLNRFSGLFGRIPPRSDNALDNIDHCPDRPEIGIQYYCMKLEDGIYYDPWNPWCGFIRCNAGVAERVCCKQGTWLGMKNLHKANQKDMCRRPLQANQLEGDRCPLPNTRDICRAAKKVEKMNPPKKKAELPLSQFSRFTNAKSAPAAPVPEEPLLSSSGNKDSPQGVAAETDDVTEK